MALMIPDYTTEFTTNGERRFYEFLARFAKPDEKFTSWYLPDLQGREPDFILYSDGIGLIVFEIKDWSLDQIEEADRHTFVLLAGGRRKRLKSPLIQAREYLNSLMDRIKSDGRLVSKERRFYGNPKIPLHCGVVFPNISRHAYLRRKLNEIIDEKYVFFRDDLRFGSEICSDGTGRCFQDKIAEMFRPMFRFQLTSSEYSCLKQLLFPTIQVQHTQRDACVYVDPSQRVHALDDKQEAVARRLTPEVNLVRGPAGSGKTLVLVNRAAFLKAYRPETRILFLCHNITLVNYIKRLLSERGVGLGVDGVQVFHFLEFCSKVLGEEIHSENADLEYFYLIVEETLKRLKAEPLKYDALIIDEGQHFSGDMLKLAPELLDRDRLALTVACDDGQGLHGCDLLDGLRSISEKVRIDELTVPYRNTLEIRGVAAGYIGSDAVASSCDVSGPPPQLHWTAGIEETASFVSTTIRKLVDRGEYPLSEIAVLYARGTSDGVSVPEMVIERLEAQGIVSNWVAEDYRATRSYDITTERVSISNIHSAGGLDWACVFVLGLDEIDKDSRSGEWVGKMVYVALT
ncbi:MAG: NERD domain-containing protein, partial [Syntrophobacteraceae bacterium]